MTDQQINELAENLDCGLSCYVHKKTKTIVTIPEFAFEPGNDTEEIWEDLKNEVEENFHSYVVIEKMDSHESFSMMQNFIEIVDNEGLQERLNQALNRKKPFSNFKFEVDNSGQYRQMWFDFKKQQLTEWVKRQLAVKNL